MTQRELVKNCLRMRPDRIILGEVRGAEVLDMLQAMSTGHDGSICTLHANTPRDAMQRLEMMMLLSGANIPQRAMRQQIASALNMVIHVSRLSDGSRKVMKISEISGMEGDVVMMQDLLRVQAHRYRTRRQGARPVPQHRRPLDVHRPRGGSRLPYRDPAGWPRVSKHGSVLLASGVFALVFVCLLVMA